MLQQSDKQIYFLNKKHLEIFRQIRKKKKKEYKVETQVLTAQLQH